MFGVNVRRWRCGSKTRKDARLSRECVLRGTLLTVDRPFRARSSPPQYGAMPPEARKSSVRRMQQNMSTAGL